MKNTVGKIILIWYFSSNICFITLGKSKTRFPEKKQVIESYVFFFFFKEEEFHRICNTTKPKCNWIGGSLTQSILWNSYEQVVVGSA